MLKNTYWLKLRFQPSTLLSSNKRTTDSKFQSYDVIGGKKLRRLRFRCTGIHSYELVLLKEVRWFQLYCNLKYQLWFFFFSSHYSRISLFNTASTWSLYNTKNQNHHYNNNYPSNSIWFQWNILWWPSSSPWLHRYIIQKGRFSPKFSNPILNEFYLNHFF